jgi:transposase-like protein
MSGFDLMGAISQMWIEVSCPTCGISNRVRVKEVLVESSLICRGCYRELHLTQSDASGARTKRGVQELEGVINKFMKTDIKINLNL